jgi:hypothetical protein
MSAVAAKRTVGCVGCLTKKSRSLQNGIGNDSAGLEKPAIRHTMAICIKFGGHPDQSSCRQSPRGLQSRSAA